MTRIVLPFAATIMFMASATGQNLLTNPTFVGSTTGWETTPNAVWDDSLNRDGSAGSDDGALRISTPDSDTASQCIVISPGEHYIVGASVINDPSVELEPCVTSAWRLDIEWWDSTECAAPSSSMLDDTRVGPDDRTNTIWFDEKQTLTAPTGATRARIVFGASCSSHSGSTHVLFDDALFVRDEIVERDFETHASEGGPGSG